MDAWTERERTTPDAHWIIYAFYPWDQYTQTEVRLEARVDGIGSSLVVWHGNLPVGRRDLKGKPPRDVAIMLGDELWRHLHPDISADLAARIAVATGVPLGTTGGTVTQDPLPGL